MNAKTFKRLNEGLDYSTSPHDFFMFLWRCVNGGIDSSAAFYIKFSESYPITICFTMFLHMNDKAANLVLNIGRQKGYFVKTKEVRFIGSYASKETAILYKEINDFVNVYYVTENEYLDYILNKESPLVQFKSDPLFCDQSIKSTPFKPI